VIKDPVCAIQVLDLRSREIVGSIEFKGLLNELFDIQVLPGVLKPFMVGFEEELIDQLFSIYLTVP
jgi:protein O-GlcNAc transferase